LAVVLREAANQQVAVYEVEYAPGGMNPGTSIRRRALESQRNRTASLRGIYRVRERQGAIHPQT